MQWYNAACVLLNNSYSVAKKSQCVLFWLASMERWATSHVSASFTQRLSAPSQPFIRPTSRPTKSILESVTTRCRQDDSHGHLHMCCFPLLLQNTIVEIAKSVRSRWHVRIPHNPSSNQSFWCWTSISLSFVTPISYADKNQNSRQAMGGLASHFAQASVRQASTLHLATKTAILLHQLRLAPSHFSLAWCFAWSSGLQANWGACIFDVVP